MTKRKRKPTAHPCAYKVVRGMLCGRPGVARASLVLRSFVGESGLELELDVPACVTHREGVKVEHLMSAETWAIARRMYEAARRSTPLRSLTTLRWHAIGDHPSIYDPEVVAT